MTRTEMEITISRQKGIIRELEAKMVNMSEAILRAKGIVYSMTNAIRREDQDADLMAARIEEFEYRQGYMD